MIGVLARWLGLLVVGYVAGRLYGLVVIRRRGTDEQVSRGTYQFLTAVGLVSLLVLTFSGLIDTTKTALSSVHPLLGSGLATPLAWAPTAAGTIVAVLVGYLGVFPYARERRGIEISAPTAVARLGKYLVAITIFCLGLLAPVTALFGAPDPSPLLIPVVFAVLVVGVYAWLQYSIRLTQDISDPTADQRRRLEAAADRADLTATVAGVFAGRETETAGLYLDGPFWNRQVYATDYAFDVLDDEELAALCARGRAADELRLLERRSLVVAALFGLFVTLTVWLSILVALAALAVTWLLLVRHLQRCEFAADRRAAREIGVEPLTSAYESTPSVTDSRSRLHERLAATPSTARRLEGLRQSD